MINKLQTNLTKKLKQIKTTLQLTEVMGEPDFV